MGIDAILYPKQSKKPAAPAKKTRRAAIQMDAKDPSTQYMEVEGLRGYGKSGARVSAILNEMSAKTLLQKAQSNMNDSQ